MTDLFVGAGKGIGQGLHQSRFAAGHAIFHITGKDSVDENTFTVDWASVRESDLHKWLRKLPEIDLIFFNQNSSSLSKESFGKDGYDTIKLWKQLKHWNQSHWVSCRMPFDIIHTLSDRLHSESRVCWMLSSLVVRHNHEPEHADYIANKFQNYLMMKNFARNHPSCFLAFDPGDVSGPIHTSKIQIINDILSRPKSEINGHVFDMSGNESEIYKIFR